MTLETWFTFVIASLILTVTPGPSILLGMVHSVNYGLRKTLFTALGDISANFIQMVLVAVGLGVIIANSEMAFQIIKWFGVVTLIYLGIKMILSKPITEIESTETDQRSNRTLFFSGFMVAAGNPKAIVFFSAFFPLFINPSEALLPQMLIMCPTMAALDFTMVMLYAYTAKKAAHTIKAKGHIINRYGGGALITASGFLATSQR